MADENYGSVKRGYDLAAEALYYIADKLSLIRDDNDQLRSELIRQGLDVNVEDWRAKAKRLREMYNREETKEPDPGSRERENYILKMEEEDSFVNSIRGLICFALGVYANDIIKTREDIPWQIVIREPTPEQVKTFLKMDDVGRQLKMIQIAMEKDYCGKY